MWENQILRLNGEVFNPEIEEKAKRGKYGIPYGSFVVNFDLKSLLESKQKTNGKIYGVYHINDYQDSEYYNVVVEIAGNSIEEITSNILEIEQMRGFERDSQNYRMYTTEWVYFKVVFADQPFWRKIWANMWF